MNLLAAWPLVDCGWLWARWHQGQNESDALQPIATDRPQHGTGLLAKHDLKESNRKRRNKSNSTKALTLLTEVCGGSRFWSGRGDWKTRPWEWVELSNVMICKRQKSKILRQVCTRFSTRDSSGLPLDRENALCVRQQREARTNHHIIKSYRAKPVADLPACSCPLTYSINVHLPSFYFHLDLRQTY